MHMRRAIIIICHGIGAGEGDFERGRVDVPERDAEDDVANKGLLVARVSTTTTTTTATADELVKDEGHEVDHQPFVPDAEIVVEGEADGDEDEVGAADLLRCCCEEGFAGGGRG